MKLNEEQLKRLWEENLNMHFWYGYDDIKSAKRPFGNSGDSQIFKDIKDLLNLKIKFEVESEDEASDKIYNFVEDILNQMTKFASNSDDKFEIKLISKKSSEGNLKENE